MSDRGKTFKRNLNKPFRGKGLIAKKRKTGLPPFANFIHTMLWDSANFKNDITLGGLLHLSGAFKKMIFIIHDCLFAMGVLRRK